MQSVPDWGLCALGDQFSNFLLRVTVHERAIATLNLLGQPWMVKRPRERADLYRGFDWNLCNTPAGLCTVCTCDRVGNIEYTRVALGCFPELPDQVSNQESFI